MKLNMLSRRLRRFRKDEDGLVMTEILIMLPLLIWTFAALFIWWDAFRTINLSQKASYAVSDLISRQSEVDLNFISGMQEVMDYLSESPDNQIRVTSIEWDQQGNRYTVLFSRSPGNALPELTSNDLQELADRIPVMADNETVVIVETLTPYAPILKVGVNNQMMENFVVTRPRFHRRVCLVEQPCPAEL